MTRFMKLLSVAALVGAVATGTASLAQEKFPEGAPDQNQHEHDNWQHGPWEHRRGGRLFAVFQQLDLSDTQKAAIRSILEAAKPKIDAIREERRKNREPLREITPDDPKYSAIVAQVSKNEADAVSRLIQQMAATKADVYKQLTADQKAKLEKIKADIAFRRALDGGMGENGHRHGAWDRPEEPKPNP